MKNPPRNPESICGCGGKGWILFQELQLQRCDECQKFPGDLEAAMAFFRHQSQKTSSRKTKRFWLDTITVKPTQPHT